MFIVECLVNFYSQFEWVGEITGWRCLMENENDVRRLAAEALNRVPPGPLGTELFDAVSKHSVGNAFEAACLRRGATGQLQVYLRKRADDDTAYPGQWHLPGSFRRPGEKWDDVMQRLSQGEFKAVLCNRRLAGAIDVLEEERGTAVSFVFLVDLEEGTGETDSQKWFDVDGGLPQPMVAFHEEKFIPLAVVAFLAEEAVARLGQLKAQFGVE